MRFVTPIVKSLEYPSVHRSHSYIIIAVSTRMLESKAGAWCPVIVDHLAIQLQPTPSNNPAKLGV